MTAAFGAIAHVAKDVGGMALELVLIFAEVACEAFLYWRTAATA